MEMPARPVRKRLPHAIPHWLNSDNWYFLTINCVPRGQNQLCRAYVGASVLATMAHQHDHSVWRCRVALLMPDHLHAIVAFGREAGMKLQVSGWKRYVARQLGIRWQRDFFDHRLRDHHEIEEKLSYILLNPVRRGLCQRVEDWQWVYRPMERLR